MSNERFRVMLSKTPGSQTLWTVGYTKTLHEAKAKAVKAFADDPTGCVATILAVYQHDPRVIGSYTLKGKSKLHALFEEKMR